MAGLEGTENSLAALRHRQESVGWPADKQPAGQASRSFLLSSSRPLTKGAFLFFCAIGALEIPLSTLKSGKISFSTCLSAYVQAAAAGLLAFINGIFPVR